MRLSWVWLTALIVSVLLPASGAAWARVDTVKVQTNNRVMLDKLFEELKSAPNESAAREISDQIWRAWFKTDNADVNALMTRVRMAQQAGLSELAIKELDKIIQIEPEYVEGWNQRATILFMLGRDGESVRDIAQVLRLEPRHFGALAGLGLIHMRAENWKSAVASFERALAVHPFLGERALLPELRKKLKGQAL